MRPAMKLALRFQKAVAVAMEGNSAFNKQKKKKKNRTGGHLLRM